MLVEEIMKPDIVTITKHTTIKEAMQLLHKKKIRHIPVVEEDRTIAGIVSDRDIRDASPSIFHLKEHEEDLQLPASKIMKSPVITVQRLDFVEEAAVILYENDISALPVVTEGEKVIGILTETDVLHTLVKLTGAHQPSSRIEVQVPNISGQLADISAIFKENKVNVISVLVYPDQGPETKILTFRVQTMDPRHIIQKIEAKGYEIMWPRVPGINQ
ncbi:acetoin utilization AcuB family protein [Alteribacillus bidgolensis]|uniref:Acetoin utilization protein AcuB n=1 Tax=Alteribacillus bidgolensis TaxID=930129 RepID=A0A1G8ETH8_9BACI|nr:acetoin utilization AcuB family protein [Alteribacillus bidgolensis]SDH73203.1 acetoin utilization protein AcuB [Alteribacillus bidgolensis]